MYEAYLESGSFGPMSIKYMYAKWTGQAEFQCLGVTTYPMTRQRHLAFLWALLILDEDPPVPVV